MGEFRTPLTGRAPDAGNQVNAWLGKGGLVVTASDRTSRALISEFNRTQQKQGLTAWPAPPITDWRNFVRTNWQTRDQNRASDERLVLNPVQEQAIWAGIAASHRQLATLLEGPLHRLAQLAMEAHDLLCSYAPQYLREGARSAWQQDAEAFSGWLAEFDRNCRQQKLLSPSRLPLELVPLLESDPSPRSPLLLVGFDRLLPLQRELFDAWGEWQELAGAEPASDVHFYAAPDARSERIACALWCRKQLDQNPHARLLVVAQSASARRGPIERAFLEYAGPASLFEFSLGIPLSQVAQAKGAHMLLRWLAGQSLAEQQLDWLLSTGQIAATPEESTALQASVLAMRRHGLERPLWSLQAFLGQPRASERLPLPWMERIVAAQSRLEPLGRRPQSPLDWAELAPQLLEAAGWPGFRPLSSTEFQAANRWQQAEESAASLGFDNRRISFHEFLAALARTLDETLFTPESSQAPILIAGPAESSGLTADAIWFLGADEDNWPVTGPAHPLLPSEVQRAAKMPHSTPQADAELAETITRRLLVSAPTVHFSFARQTEDAEARPSGLVLNARTANTIAPCPILSASSAERVGSPSHYSGAGSINTQPGSPLGIEELPPHLTAPDRPDAQTAAFADDSRIPFPAGRAEGGSSVLTYQSQCPFKAFATARLGARSWQPAEAALTAAQRGQLLHAVLHAIWTGPPTGKGIRTLSELRGLADPGAFVANHVEQVFAAELRPDLRERIPERYLELEEERLTRLITEWLSYESTRVDFEVAGTEVSSTIVLGELTLRVRLDRVDRLSDDTLLVIDYKTGLVSPKSWDLPRPDDVQLPLYAGFALSEEACPGMSVAGEVSGLVFAKLRAGDLSFVGRVGDAQATLLPDLKGGNALVKSPFTAEQLIDWRETIEQLARDFVAGKAEVDPREALKTCERCGLHTLCRIQENQSALSGDEESEEAEDE
jgi:RecB family exonuclease